MRRLALFGLLLLGCDAGERSFTQPVTLAGREVSADTLNTGEFLYMQRCRGCHGADGHGDGPYASSMETSPADLTTGAYRHLEGSPPSDEAFRDLLEHGIEGTPMGPQHIPDDQVDPVVQYVRWLALSPSEP